MWFYPYTLPKTHLKAPRIYLRPPRLADYPAWSRLRRQNQMFLKQWEPTWSSNALTRADYKARLRQQVKNWRGKRSYAFLIFLADTHEIIGGININNVIGGVSCTASLGYWLGQAYTGHGYMGEAIHAVRTYAFDVLNLHRIEAACLFHNTASQNVLKKSGFTYEGLVRKYLKINGRWQDHMLFSFVREDLEIKDKIPALRQVA